jgi:hypothetical protein
MSHKTLAVLTSLFLFSQIARAQSAISALPQATRDPQAVAIVQTALTAMDGSGLVGAIQGSVESGTTTDSSAPESSPATFISTYAGGQFREEVTSASGGHVLVSNAGAPQDYRDGSWQAQPSVVTRTNLPFHVPALVLSYDLNDSVYAFTYLGTTTVSSNNVVHIRIVDVSDLAGQQFTAQDWYFNSATGLPARVQFKVPTTPQPKDALPETIDFSNFQVVSGVLVPFQLAITVGPLNFLATASSVTFNTSINASQFTPSTGGAQ